MADLGSHSVGVHLEAILIATQAAYIEMTIDIQRFAWWSSNRQSGVYDDEMLIAIDAVVQPKQVHSTYS